MPRCIYVRDLGQKRLPCCLPSECSFSPVHHHHSSPRCNTNNCTPATKANCGKVLGPKLPEGTFPPYEVGAHFPSFYYSPPPPGSSPGPTMVRTWGLGHPKDALIKLLTLYHKWWPIPRRGQKPTINEVSLALEETEPNPGSGIAL